MKIHERKEEKHTILVLPVTHQAPPSLGFFRQEHWSGLPFPSLCMQVKSESEVVQSCPTLSDPMDCSPPGSSIHGILQARVLEWGAIAFSYFHYRLHEISPSYVYYPSIL